MRYRSQSEMFEAIWEERPHVSEVSGSPLHSKGHSKWHWQFAHVLSKGAFPSFKYESDNIMLMTPEEHENQERYAVFNDRKEVLKRRYLEESRDLFSNL